MCARVLVIDDDPVNADLVGYLLRAFGHDAVLALSGESALQEANAWVPDLVLCDIQMPLMDGFEVLHRLRQDARFKSTPIVGVTALAMVGDREKILAAGFDGYLAKPITPEIFIPQIEKYLPMQPDLQKPLLARGVATTPAVVIAPPKSSGYALVVDDVPANVELLHHLITSLGVEVRTASNTKDALRIARQSKPNLIISDIHMPGADGLELLAAAKSDPLLKDVPFVLISSSQPTVDDERRAHASGVDGFLLRPLDPEAMLDHLAKWMPR